MLSHWLRMMTNSTALAGLGRRQKKRLGPGQLQGGKVIFVYLAFDEDVSIARSLVLS
jgi:hypothetical protein